MLKTFDDCAPGLALSSKAAETAGAPFEQAGKGRDALLNCLISGGDEGLECEPATGLNMYGHGPSPRPQDLAFGSSTASTISAPAFAAGSTGTATSIATGSC